MDEQTKQAIEKVLSAKRIVLFMKGTPSEPRCGYSARVVEALKKEGVEFEGINVLENPVIWEGIKEFSNWPTIPQLYVKSKLIGGCDITLELAASGELTSILKESA